MAQKPHTPDEKSKKQVLVMAGIGLTHDQIAKIMQVSDETLRKYYRDELETGKARMNSAVAQNLYSIATSRETGAVAAAIFWMKTRAEWREVNRNEITGANGEPIKHDHSVKLDVSALNEEQQDKLYELLSLAKKGSLK